jgi:hypothetical protein
MLAVASSTAVMAGAGHAQTPDAPKRKSGLWEMTTQVHGMPAMPTVQQCIDQKTDDLFTPQEGKSTCTVTQQKRTGDRLEVVSVCKESGSTSTAHAVFVGSFDSQYRAEVHVTYDPPQAGRKEATLTTSGKWLSACKAGQKPGDVIMPGMPGGMR